MNPAAFTIFTILPSNYLHPLCTLLGVTILLQLGVFNLHLLTFNRRETFRLFLSFLTSVYILIFIFIFRVLWFYHFLEGDRES